MAMATANGASRRPAAAGRDLHFPGGCALQGLSQPGRGVAGGLHHRAHHGLEDGRAGALLVLGGDGGGGLRARARCAGLSKTTLPAHRHRRGAPMGAALRHRRRRPRIVDGHLVSAGVRQDLGHIRAVLQLLPDAGLHDRHIREKLRQQSAGDGADRLRRHSHDDRAFLGRRRLLHGLCVRARALFRDAETHFRPPASRSARRRRRRPRCEPARRPVRHCAQQHAARAVHVRRRAPRGGVQQAAGGAARCGARRCEQAGNRARAGRRMRSRRSAVERACGAPAGGVRERVCGRRHWRGVRRDRARAHAGADVSPDGRRGRGRSVRGHHRSARGRGQDQSAGPLRRAHRPAESRALPRPDGRRGDGPAPPRAVRHPLRRPRRVQAGQRHAGPPLRR